MSGIPRLLLPVALAALALAPGAAGGNTIQLKIGDAVDVVGTPIACFAIESNKKDGIGCVVWAKDKPKVGSFGVGLAVDGTAVLNTIKADGTSRSIFKGRTVQARAKVYRVKVGESFGLPAGGDVVLGCQVLNVTSTAVEPVYRGTKVSCWLANATSPIPSRYGVSISGRFAGVFKVTSAGKISTWGLVRRQPAG